MKKKTLLQSAFLFATATVAITACRKENVNVQNELKPRQDVFAVDYNQVPNSGVVGTVFSPKTLNNDVAGLGRVLFYDTRLSLSGTTACASCHKQELGFADNVAFSAGFKMAGTSMNAMALSNIENDFVLFWQNRASSLEELSLMPVANHLEMGFVQVEDVVTRLKSIPYYKEQFARIFGQDITQNNISSALSEFMRSLRSLNSKYDKGFKGNAREKFNNFTEQENLGKELFFNKYNCAGCHGVPSILESGWSENFTNIGLDGPSKEDPQGNNGFFKAPSLRNIAMSGPYMHDGRFKTLEEVIDHYSSGIQMNPSLSWMLQDFDFTTGKSSPKKFNIPEQEKEALISFLHTLSDHSYARDKRFSNPFLP